MLPKTVREGRLFYPRERQVPAAVHPGPAAARLPLHPQVHPKGDGGHLCGGAGGRHPCHAGQALRSPGGLAPGTPHDVSSVGDP
jgi:hypothetical protein